jgi:FkbM family methyltransferase
MKINLEKFYLSLNLAHESSEVCLSQTIQSKQLEYHSNLQNITSNDNFQVFISSKIGWISIAPFSQGKVGNLNLFGPHELVIFYRYDKWISNYRLNNPMAKVFFVDMGANIGVHSLVFSRLAGEENSKILCIEPNETISEIRKKNFIVNRTSAVTHLSGAIVPNSFPLDNVEFIECLDNLTASTTTLTGKEIYGDTRIRYVSAIKPAELINILREEVCGNLLIVKVDIEGSEADFLYDFIPSAKDVLKCDLRLAIEVSSVENAARLFELIRGLDSDWTAYSDLTVQNSKITSLDEVPKRWSQGSLYIEAVISDNSSAD